MPCHSSMLTSLVCSLVHSFVLLVFRSFVLSFVHSFSNSLHQIVASELKDPICHSNECQIGSFSSEATRCWFYFYKAAPRSFVCSCVRSLVHSFVRLFSHSLHQMLILSLQSCPSFVCSCVRSFVRSLVRLFSHSLHQILILYKLFMMINPVNYHNQSR